MRTREEKWRFESPRVTSNLERSDGLVHCSVKNAAVLCKNHRERVTQIWTSLKKKKKKRKKKKKEKHFGRLATFWFSTFTMLFSTTGCAIPT